jgi:hypothetical protein
VKFPYHSGGIKAFVDVIDGAGRIITLKKDITVTATTKTDTDFTNWFGE